MNRLSLAAALVLLPASSVIAQVATDTARIDPVVVTATRNPLAIGDLPASVTVLQGADLRARGVTSVADALREVPGVGIARSGSFMGVTSVFTRGGQGSYTKVLIDGVPMPATQPSGGFDWSTLSTDNVERIEVVRGPSSVVWGSDAVTGVVNVITRSGRGGPRMSAAVRAGNLGTVDGEAQVSRSTQAATYSVGLAHHRTDGIYPFNNANGQTVFSGRADAAIDEKTDGSFSIRYTDNVAHYPTDGSGNPVDSNAFTSANQLALDARLRRILTSRLSVQGAVAASAHDGGTDDAAGQGSTDSFETLDHFTRRSAELRGMATLGTGTVATVGGVVEQQAQRSQSQSGGAFPSNSVFGAVRHNHAAFAELVNATAKSTVTLGGRVDGNEEFGTFGTFRVAGQLEVLPGTRVRANVGTAYRQPAFEESFTTNQFFSRGNPHLRPEHSRSWEAGVSYGSAVRIEATYFNQRFADMIDYNGAAADPEPNYNNIAKAQANGVEVELHHPAVFGVFFDLSGSVLDSKVLESGNSASPTATLAKDSALVRRPKSTGSFRLGYVGIPRLRTDVLVTYVGERPDRRFNPDFTVSAITLPAYGLVDWSAEYALPAAAGRPTVTLTFRAANVLDQPYNAVDGFLAPGRQILGGARISY
jgi:vitamin B12 transporter